MTLLNPFAPMRPELRSRLFRTPPTRSRLFDPMLTGPIFPREERAAPAQTYSDSIMVALLPEDPSWSRQTLPHVTVVYAGQIENAAADLRARLEAACSEVADRLDAFSSVVSGTDVFGQEHKVDVLTLELDPALETLRAAVEFANASEFKDFRPHATVGPEGSVATVDVPTHLYFERLILCWGDEQVTWFLREQRVAGGQFAKGGGRVPGRGTLSNAQLDDFATPAGASAQPHLESDGKGGMRFTAERAALHEKLIQEQLVGLERSANPTTTVLGGGPGSGKSTSAEAAGVPPKGKAAWADPDEMKKGLPEYDPKSPSGVHEESSYLAKQVASRAQQKGYDVVIDGVGDNPASVGQKVAEARANGHRVVANYTTTSIPIAQDRNLKRERSVDPDMLADKHRKVSRNFTKVAELDFDEVTLWENNWTPGAPTSLVKVASKSGSGPLSVLDDGAWTTFLGKSAD